MEYNWVKITYKEFKELDRKGVIVRKQLRIPDDVSGILNVIRYVDSFNPKDATINDYDYFKRGEPYIIFGEKLYYEFQKILEEDGKT